MSGGDAGEAEAIEPTDLRYVGPATAEVIESAPFAPADLRDRTVSYADLLAAGVNPGVAAKLRHEYSLVWSFAWVAGAHLDRRAEQVTGLDPDQRAWIAASASTDGGRAGTDDHVSEAERAWRERAAWTNTGSDGTRSCQRCGDSLTTFQMGEQESVLCEGCGYVGVPARSR